MTRNGERSNRGKFRLSLFSIINWWKKNRPPSGRRGWKLQEKNSRCLPTYISINLSAHPPVYLSIHVTSIYFSIYTYHVSTFLFMYRLSTYQPINLCPSIYLSTSLYQTFYPSILLPVCLSIYPSFHLPSIYLSIHLPVYLPIIPSTYLSIHLYTTIPVHLSKHGAFFKYQIYIHLLVSQ